MISLRLSLFASLVLLGCGGKTIETPIDTTDSGSADETAIVDTGETGEIRDDAPPDPPPDTTPPPTTTTDKLDLLFVVDNSLSMADKQALLAKAIPGMIRDLTQSSGGKVVASLHVGVITSSLGSHGTSACAADVNRSNNDRGHLLPRATDKSCTTVSASPLGWAFDPSVDKAEYYGTKGSEDVAAATACVVQSAKENGCGYEETLEAMYHFLVDPAPYAKAEVKCTFGVSGDMCGSNKIIVEGLDEELLNERAAFLRPDSTVVIVVVSDENDFSLKPAALNWVPWGFGKGQMQPGWTSCKTVPDDFEPETGAELMKLREEYKCFSCFENASDPGCKVAWATSPLNNDVDGRNVRGFHQVQRFGYNFLWGRQRYVDALTKPMVFGSDSKLAPNPLFASGRSLGNVIFASIVGLPPNLVKTSDGLPKSMLNADNWSKLVGPIGTRDPHMIESIAPRMGVAKFTGDRTVDPVHGGDRDQPDGDDLQYACIAPRATPGPGYDCEGPDASKRNPICGPSGQAYYKAYPGLRHLRVAQAVNGFVGSICDPKLDDVLKALAGRVKPLIK